MYTLLTPSGITIIQILTDDTEMSLSGLFNSLLETAATSIDGINSLKAYLEKPIKPAAKLKSYNTVKVYQTF